MADVEVNVRLKDGRVILARAFLGGWMGGTPQRPYPDFEEVVGGIPMSNGIHAIDPRYNRSEGQARADEIFIATAFLMATRSTCTRGNVGAVAVQDRRIVATGYNGAPPGLPHCTDPDIGCDLSAGPEGGCQRSVHAEANLVAWAARAGVPLRGAYVYSTHSPCRKCAELLLSAGIAEFHYSKPYRLGEPGMLTQAGVYVVDHGGATHWPENIS